MAKYKAEPNYVVKVTDTKSVTFGFDGNYETNDKDEQSALDNLAPIYVKKLDEPKGTPKQTKPSEAKPKATPKPKAKPSDK